MQNPDPKPTPTNPPNNPSPIRLRLGTRGSALARWQADWVAARLTELGATVELVPITTGGDRSSLPIRASAAQGVFTKEIQKALLDERIDLAVHSLKDLPTEPVEGLVLAAVPPRESPWDVLVSHAAPSLDQLPRAARLGTGSVRRQSQSLHARPDLRVLDIRGNVETRLRKLDEGQYDAIVLAEAGLKRLNLESRITERLSATQMLPAIGQGALGLEIRAGDDVAQSAAARLDDPAARAAVVAERTMLAELRGGCLAPIGAWGRIEGQHLILDGVVLSADGSRRLDAQATGPPEEAATVGREVARELLDDGAAQLVGQARA